MLKAKGLAAAAVGALVALGGVVLGQGGRSAGPGGQGAAAAVAERVGVSSCVVQVLPVAMRAEGMVLTLTLGGRVVNVQLEPVTLRGAGFRLMVERDGVLSEEAAAPEMNFSAVGVGEGSEGVWGRLSVYRGSWRGVIDLGDGGPLWWVQPMSDTEPGAPSDKHVVYSESEVVWAGGTCPGGVPAAATLAGRAKGALPGCALRTQIAFDTDTLFYTLNGSSVANTQADIESVLNAMSLIYARDTLVHFVISATIVRTSTSPYSSPDASTMLDQMVGEWGANQTAVVRDIAHLMTGRDLTGTTIGLAYNGVVCDQTFGMGLSQSRYSANFTSRVAVTAHEVGHNFNADHCNGDVDCAIMCATAGGCSGNSSRFGVRSIGSIKSHAATRPCLEESAGSPAAVAPYAAPDSVVAAAGGFTDIDVLANDQDGNCNTLTIQSFPSSTSKGVLTRQVGAGPGGRDLIRYAANAGASGTDTLSVVVADGTGLTATGVLTVTIPLPKPADHVGPTRPSLDGSYYRLQGQHSVQDFAGLSWFRAGTFTNTPINFVSTTGNFANSLRADNLAALATATLNVPTAGAWTFFTQSDEGSLLYIDGVPVVNNDFAHTSQERSGVVASLSAGNHSLRVEYFERTGPCELIVRWQGPGTAKQVIPGNRLTGLRIEYYDLPAPLVAIPSMGALTPIAQATTAQVNFPSSTGNFGASGRSADVGAMFTGLVHAPTAGLYTFYLESDEGSRLTLGANQLVVDHNGVHAMTEARGQVNLLAGWHTLKLEYFGAASPNGLIARYEGPGIVKQVVPASAFGRLPVQCNGADIGRQGGLVGFDGVLDNNDFIAFIDLFFIGNAQADLGRQGGTTPGDGTFDNNDFVVFIDLFFSPCL